MSRGFLQALFIVLLPTIVLGAGGWIAKMISNRTVVAEQHRINKVDCKDRKTLGVRFGYDAEAVQRIWGNKALNNEGRRAELGFLRADLALAAAIAAGYAICLLTVWGWLGRPFHPAYLLVPVIALLLADWTENWLLIGQMERLMAVPQLALQAGRVRLASAATITKLVLYFGIYLGLLYLAWRAVPSNGGPPR